ncbi:MAG: hypothetical protein JJU10_01180 [Idiomarina sp.]|nr:hypothetical protein [Idiomarina sp.]
MEIASQGPKTLELVSLQLAKGKQEADGAATLELLESAAQSAPQQSTPGAAIGSIINTTA